MTFLLRRRGLGKASCDAIVAKSQTGIKVYRNDAPTPEADMVIRWGCTSNVQAKVIVNDAKAIHTASDKKGFRLRLDEAGLSPKTWGIPGATTYPCVVRPAVHAQGNNLYLCHNHVELRKAWEKVGFSGYISEFIDKVAEYRVYAIQGRVMGVASKAPCKGVAWNLAQGGKFTNVRWGQWPLEAIRFSLEAMRIAGLDFGGVDVIVDREGHPYVLEINSAPSLMSAYRQTGMAKIFDHIVTHGKEPIPVGNKPDHFSSYIHPVMLG